MPVTLFFSFDWTPTEKLAQAENSYANAARDAWRLNQPNWAACFGHGYWTGAYTHLWSRVAYVLFSLAFAWYGKYNATSIGLREHDICMLNPLNPKLNKHSVLRLDKFLSTWGGSALHLSSLPLSEVCDIIIIHVHGSEVMWAISNPILVIAREKSVHKQWWYFYNLVLHWQSTQSRCLTN